MSVGPKVIFYNPSERAVSSDNNRAQTFADADRAEQWRAMADTYRGTDDFDAGSLFTPFTTEGTPAIAEVIGGLLVTPQLGATLNLTISPGSVGFLSPDSPQNPDESLERIINDPGVQTLGALVMSANASGSPRTDVIECQRVVNVLETDNRDVFNPVTQLFTTGTVNKVIATQLTYRVRLGTPAAGRPAAALGWLPLAYAFVPSGATTNDQMTFWDVRPLISSRIVQPHNLTNEWPHAGDIDYLADGETYGTSHTVLTGRCDVRSRDLTGGGLAGLYRLGGRIRRGSPGTDLVLGTVDGVDLLDAANLSPDAISPGINYIYLLAPGGLPWARYTDPAFGVRQPRSPRGLLVVSSTKPLAGGYGCPSAPIAWPTSFGWTGQTEGHGVCIGVVSLAFIPSSHTVTRGKHDNLVFLNTNGPISPTTATAVSSTLYTINWTLIDGTTHPPNARAIYVNVDTQHVFTAGPEQISASIIFDIGGVGGVIANTFGINPGGPITHPVLNLNSGAGLVKMPTIQLRIPLASVYPHSASPAARSLFMQITYSAAVVGLPTPSHLSVVGWEF